MRRLRRYIARIDPWTGRDLDSDSERGEEFTIEEWTTLQVNSMSLCVVFNGFTAYRNFERDEEEDHMEIKKKTYTKSTYVPIDPAEFTQIDS